MGATTHSIQSGCRDLCVSVVVYSELLYQRRWWWISVDAVINVLWSYDPCEYFLHDWLDPRLAVPEEQKSVRFALAPKIVRSPSSHNLFRYGHLQSD